MKSPYYIPKPDKDAKEWRPGDEPSAQGFWEGLRRGRWPSLLGHVNY